MNKTAILVVSHSKTLALGVKEVASQMAGSPDSVWAVGGTEDGGIGTTAPAIRDTLEQALDTASEVVVLMDLGSAYLNTVTAIEMLDAPLRKRVTLADAPLIEGAVLAVVAAASGDTAADVRARAEEARDMHKLT
jgi:dihydroxyacetone kinase phosphotransfer subunit